MGDSQSVFSHGPAARGGEERIFPPMQCDSRHTLHTRQPYRSPVCTVLSCILYSFFLQFTVSHYSHSSIGNPTPPHHTTQRHTLYVILPRSPTPHLCASHCPCSGIFVYSASEYRRYTVPGLTRPVRPARWTAEAVSTTREEVKEGAVHQWTGGLDNERG